MDYSSLSDNSLKALHSGDYSGLSDNELKSLHDQMNPSPEAVEPKEESFGKQLLRGTLDALPIAGGAGAGILASESGPGAVPAAALGYAGGRQLQKLGHKYLLGEKTPDQNPVEQAKDVVGDAATGAGYEMGGQILSAATNPVFQFLKNKFSLPVPAAQVAEAAPANFPTAPSYPEGPLVDQYGKALPSSVATSESVAANVPQIAPTPASAPPAAKSGSGILDKMATLSSVGTFVAHPTLTTGANAAFHVAKELPGAVQGAGNMIGKLSGVLSSNPQALGAYSQPLIKAMQGGEHSLAVTDFLMGQSDPQYRKTRDSLLSQSDGQ